MKTEISPARPATSPSSLVEAGTIQQKATRLAFLTNFIPPYWKPVLQCLSTTYPHLRVLVSTAMEPDRSWKVDWEGLDVVLQRTITFEEHVRNRLGFRELVYVHLPIDTVSQLRRFKADVVISAEFGFRTVLSIVYRRLNPGSRLIVYADLSQRTEQGRGWLRALVRKLISRNVDTFVVLGEGGARYVRELGVAKDKIFKVPYATDVVRFRDHTSTRSNDSARRLLYVGRLVERKGLLQFIVSLSEWLAGDPSRQAELVLAGDGPLRSRLEETALPASLRLTFLGDQDYNLMPEIYTQSGILVFPTFADTWGLVVNEAMAAGLPVLGSIYSQAVEELVQDDWNGWTFRTDHADEMLSAIHRCMTVPTDTLQAMRERARSIALRLTSDEMARRIQNVIDSVMPRGKA